MIEDSKLTAEPGGLFDKWERRPVLLFVDHSVPQYDLYAGSRTNFMYLKVLVEMGFEIKFLPTDFFRIEPYSTELNKMGIETLDGDWYRGNWKDWLRANGQSLDYVFFHKPDPAAVVMPEILDSTSAAIIYQCHDLHHLRLQRKAEIDNDPATLEEAKEYVEKEDYVFSNSDVLLTFSEVEERYLREKYPEKKIYTVPLFFYDGTEDVGRDFSARQDLLFVGACAHTPNQDAIAWFSKEVLPLVQEKLPGVVFNVVSADPPEEIAELASDSIRILGRVSEEELTDLYRTCRLMVVPLRFGAGVKGKVIEALHKGLPIVSTGIGLEGIKGIEQLASPQDTAQDFAAELVSLYTDQDKLQRLSVAGSEFVAEHFTTAGATRLMLRVMGDAIEEMVVRIATSLPSDSDIYPTRMIALYLPQFHPIPENDRFWGKGFTEWHNVKKATPLFPGHHQPHVPADLGYYDLRNEETRIAQADLARYYGIEGFCYYHYWFNGHRLLEHPLEELLKSGVPDFPFCICWANENWTRRWDGRDKELLMQQDYSEEDDRNHIRTLIPIFMDKRYIRINGKPLFLVYRTSDMPDPGRTAEIWREEARNAGLGELHLCRVESMDKTDPREMGFDSATEFAPDWQNRGKQITDKDDLPADASDELREACEKNYVHYYEHLADAMMAKPTPDYKRFRCVTPSWDNWARRKKDAAIFLSPSPEKYKSWLSRMIADTNRQFKGEERVLFVNAWNEWAEGCHLEPDEKFGHSYLVATKQALEFSKRKPAKHLLRYDNTRLVQIMDRVIEYRRQLEQLEAQLNQRDEKIEEMLFSTSWRLTTPVRWFKQRWLNLIDHFLG